MSDYRLTVGLEVHAELKTATKMFCACANDSDERQPNTHVCPVCLAHPGTLPVINREAVRKVLLVGTAVGGTLADYTEFDRKNYFYPDIPKGYQISQYKHPLVQGGSLAGVMLTRIHLEEDTARSQHQGESSLVDYNRAGVPLMELVTEPVIHSAEDAARFAKELQLLLRYLGAGEANLEKGEMRVEANISVSKGSALGTKVEVKNLNSFRSVERAIGYEFTRQTEVLEGGGTLVQETRGWDEAKQATFSQRKKESSHDYRYFPDPDLPKLLISEVPDFSAEVLGSSLPELPWQKRDAYRALGLKEDAAEILVRDRVLGVFFDAIQKDVSEPIALLAASYIGNDIVGRREAGEVNDAWFTNENGARLIKLAELIASNSLSSRGAKDTLALMFTDNRDPEVIAKEKGLMQQSDASALDAIAAQVVGEHPGPAGDYRAGKEAAMQFLVGQGMKASQGSANPQALREAIIRVLG